MTFSFPNGAAGQRGRCPLDRWLCVVTGKLSLLPWGVFRLILRRSISAGGVFPYGQGVPQLAQNLPLFTVPQAQVHSSEAGLG